MALFMGFVAIAVVALALFYGAPFALRKREVRSLAARARRDRTAVLSYDDGPGRRLTTALLNLLGEHGVKATFFALGRRAEAAPDVLDQVRAAGHEVGCHAFEHVSAWRAAPGAAWGDARRGFRGLERWVSSRGWFRPPHGKLDLVTLIWLRMRGAGIAWWTLDSGDTWESRPSPESVAQRMVESGGGVVLMHDFDGTEEHDEFVLATTRALVEAAKRNGIHLRTLGEWLGR